MPILFHKEPARAVAESSRSAPLGSRRLFSADAGVDEFFTLGALIILFLKCKNEALSRCFSALVLKKEMSQGVNCSIFTVCEMNPEHNMQHHKS